MKSTINVDEEVFEAVIRVLRGDQVYDGFPSIPFRGARELANYLEGAKTPESEHTISVISANDWGLFCEAYRQLLLQNEAGARALWYELEDYADSDKSKAIAKKLRETPKLWIYAAPMRYWPGGGTPSASQHIYLDWPTIYIP